MKVELQIRANEGYSAGDVQGVMTVGNLRRLLEYYDDDDMVITNNLNNRYGANYGVVVGVSEDYGDEDEE